MTLRIRFAYLVIGISLTITAWVTGLEWVTYDVNHYMNEYEKQDWVPAAGMDQANLAFTSEEIIRYLKGDKEDFQTIAFKDGDLQPLFDERERTHMVDVLSLYDQARFLRRVSLGLITLLGGYLVFRDTKWKNNLLRMLAYAGLGNVMLIIMLSFLIWMDFTKYFTYFHLMFFDNDLWILDPRRHVLIQLLPESFFMNTAIKISMAAVGSLSLLGLSAWLVERKIRNRRNNLEEIL